MRPYNVTGLGGKNDNLSRLENEKERPYKVVAMRLIDGSTMQCRRSLWAEGAFGVPNYLKWVYVCGHILDSCLFYVCIHQ